MVPALGAGAVAGAGAFALVRVLLRPAPGVALLVSRIDASRRSMRTHTTTALEQDAARPRRSGAGLVDALADHLDVLAAERGWELGRTRTDLALVGRSTGRFLAEKTTAGVLLFLLAPLVWAMGRLAGVPLPTTLPVVGALGLGAVGFFLPDLLLRAEAERRRRDFRHVTGVFLDLVSLNLSGGRGLPEALLAAASVSDHWAVLRLRQALAGARLMGTTPWEALGELGEDIGLEELRDLGGALGLAADDGAKIRASLSARAATLRRKEMSEAEGDEGERSQSMLVAQLLICAAFLLFLLYPAASQLMAL
jgi:Flp pilus assembly protein TadB